MGRAGAGPVTGAGEPDGVQRPAVVVALAAWLALAPVLQALSLAGLRVANFAPERPWNYLAYGLAAPYVAWLVWRRRPRARFAAFVFFTHEVIRMPSSTPAMRLILAECGPATLTTTGAAMVSPEASVTPWTRPPSPLCGCSCSSCPGRGDGCRHSAPPRCGRAGAVN